MLSTEVGNKKDASTGGFCASLQWGVVQGGETERGKRQYKCVTVGQSKGGKPAIEQKSVVGVSTVQLLETSAEQSLVCRKVERRRTVTTEC